MSKEKKSLNIPMQSSVANLRENLEQAGRKRGMNFSRVVSQIYIFAVNNPGAFPTEMDNRASHPGRHISTSVPLAIADELSKAAKDLGRSRVAHCCFLLEAVTKDSSLERNIFNHH